MKLNSLLMYLKEISYKEYIVKLLRWEMDTIAPKESIDSIINISSKYELEIISKYTDNKIIELINDLENSDEYNSLDENKKRYISKLKDDYYKYKRVPKEFYKEYTKLKNYSLNSWVKAKEKNDYKIFEPYLIQIINKTKEYYDYIYPNSNNIYNDMINEYEHGITIEQIDKLFNDIKKEIIPIINNLKPIDNIITLNKYTNDELYNISKKLLNYIGFDNNRGALGIFKHGYTTKLNNDDIRIAFNNDSNIIDHISTIIHEGGHGLFEQNIAYSLREIPTYEIDKIALHESQSRFYENILGRNINFWIPIYDEIKNDLKLDLNLEEFIKQFNNAKKSLIRTQADELTYCIHIIIRYEIEKDIFNGSIDLNNLKEIWNKKYEEYFNIKVENDNDGILQDMHWSDGSFGYFPTYLLGSIFDGMLLNNINTNLGNINDLLKNNRIGDITNYLKDNIHRHGGTYNINEISQILFKEPLNAKYIIDYFKAKYGVKND